MIRVAVVTISDSCYNGSREDRSGPALEARAKQKGWEVPYATVLPDEADRISEMLRELSDESTAQVVFTTGGTGIAQRDVTPEATRAVIDREIPGMAEHIRAEGAKSTSRAVLSRGIVGIRGRTLIVNLPGSPSGAVESFDSIADVVPHVVDLLEGRTEHRGN